MRLLLSFLSCVLLAFSAAAQPTPTKQTQYLSGRDNLRTATWDFFCTSGRKSGYWTTIQVPSCWEQQGFGAYNYGRDYKTYGKNFRFADEQGKYKHTFSVPNDWRDKAVHIVFEGAMTDAEVRVNGQLAGPVHQGAFYRFKYDISPLLKFGQPNLLEVTVSKMSADASVNNAERLADYWVFGGIFRPVYLEATPRQFIPYTAIDAKANGAFAVNVGLRGLVQATDIKAEILDNTGRVVGTATGRAAATDTVVQLRTQVAQPLTWTAETPRLYRARFTLLAGGQPLYQTTETFGFRTIEVRRGKGIYVNGTQVKMKGTNRHSWWPETGRTLNDSIHLLDVKLIKQMNMNAVRMSHYPPDAEFLHLCDSLGLYVLDELAGWQKAYSTKAGQPLVREMVRKDVNHPSIIFWDNGNEGGTNKELDAEFGRYDLSKRPVIHPHHRPGNEANGIDCNHYENYYSTQKILADSLIYMPTEFLHSQDDGGAAAGLADMWELHWKAQRSGGGFLWALVDEGIVRTDQRGIIDVNGVNAPDGVLGPHREKEGSFFALREIFSPIRITLKDLPAKFNGRVPVENRYHFNNLNQCFFHWELVKFRQPGEAFTGSSTLQKGRVASPNVAPLATGQLDLKLPKDWQTYDALVLSAFDPQKNLVFQWTWKTDDNTALLRNVLPAAAAPATPKPAAKKPAKPADTAATPAATSPLPAVQVAETDSLLTLQAGGITVTFSKLTGQLGKIKGNNGDKLSFGNGPVLVGGAATFQSLAHHAEAGSEVVDVRYQGALTSARWTMSPNGWLRLDYAYDLPKGDYQTAGLTFTYPENYVLGAKWLGKGPYRVWKNRLAGPTLNVWENPYNDTQTGAAPWLYPEFKGYFADVAWVELNTVEGKFLVASPEPGLFVRLFDFYGLSGVVPAPALPAGNLSFLDAIPPISTKLGLNIDNNPKNLGPMSEANHLGGVMRRTLYFYFGITKASGKPQPYVVPAKNDLF
ncbi:MAG TPA: glycoside hydrolase family 2 TIM barrel-domain containing protein [Hymenobacter sp.]|uniref:glycoside hydrolase family 2 TIM barrel-domain containing protein n=1 Tax=Hymenobacter sp. TaxID=1898978 RepID=UPI002D8089AD|nr:glycoside hydrolase family 2 TIM barrel-domain containing protein [Hymenobacter sp.]HET9502512.1 glycoside hydrolase family 2 TIM barrel-domain containing protein [Hymenobacter sp.]